MRSTSDSSHLTRKLFGAVVIGLVVVAAAIFIWGRVPFARTKESVELELRRARLIGSSPEQVIRYLDAHSFLHGEYQEKSASGGPDRIIVAVMRGLQQGPVFEYQIAIDFFFDKQHRLARYEVREVMIAP